MIKNLDPNTQGILIALGSALYFSLFLIAISSGDKGTMALFLSGTLILAIVVALVALSQKMTDHEGEEAIEQESASSFQNQAELSEDEPFEEEAKEQQKEEKKSLKHSERSQLIEQALSEFGVPAKVVSVKRGPRLTQYGVEPGFTEKRERNGSIKRRKIKANVIYGLEEDLALALAVKTIRIARVPEQSYIGLEVPNEESEIVPLAEILTEAKGVLPIALGADVTGQPVTADITKMPHALIAGATGSGKSICIHTILASLLANGPEKVKLLLVDPKKVELMEYNGIPHLIEPVITDMEKTVGALEKQVIEMERRSELFSQVGKRNLESYNKWAADNGHEELAYRVIVLDELADLMMAHKEQVEPLLTRLAQMARFTGLHLILATQRPTVDVVTGLIKANVPTRIAFAVASSTDSRVILDMNGAESLLGEGDGLYLAYGESEPIRMQGCFISDQELEQLIKGWQPWGNKEPLTQEEQPSSSQQPKPSPLHLEDDHLNIPLNIPAPVLTPAPIHNELTNLRTMLTSQNSFGINATEKLLREAGFTITREMRTNGTISAIAELLKEQN